MNEEEKYFSFEITNRDKVEEEVATTKIRK